MIPDQKWRQQAACIGKPLQWFFPRPSSNPYQKAHDTCQACEVRQECLDYVMKVEAAPETLGFRCGFWGGLSPDERRNLVRGAV